MKIYHYLILPTLILVGCTKQKIETYEHSSDKKGLGCIYSTNHVKIYGDTSVDQTKLYFTKVKFTPYCSFNDFLTDSLFTGKKALLDITSNPITFEFGTNISKAYQNNQVTFGGHYTITSWVHKTDSIGGVIIDHLDGKIYNLPPASLGYRYQTDSRMLLVNEPTDVEGFYYENSYHQPQIWLWNEKEKKFKKAGSNQDKSNPF